MKTIRTLMNKKGVNMNTINFTLHLAVQINGKLVSIHELPATAEYKPADFGGFELDFSLLHDDSDEIDIHTPWITNALSEAYKMAGFSKYIDRLVWDDITEEKISGAGISEGHYPAIIDDSRRWAVRR